MLLLQVLPHYRAIAAGVVSVLTLLWSTPCSAVSKVAAQRITDYAPSVWTPNEGLPNNSIRALLQTSDGYLWIGTKGGLARFNGTEFETYSARTPGQLVDSEVRALVEGADGSLYIATLGGGISVLKNGEFSTLRREDGLADDRVEALCRGDDGTIWIGTAGGLTRLRDGQLKSFNQELGQPAPFVAELVRDTRGRIWVGTRAGLYVIEGETVTDRSGELPMGPGGVSAMAADPNGGLWIAGSDGALLHGKDGSFRTMPPPLTPAEVTRSLLVDSFGDLWLGTFEGIYRLTDSELEMYPKFSGVRKRHRNTVSISDIWSLAKDREGNIWLGSSGSGLIQLRRGRFQAITAENGLPSRWVDSLVETAAGDLLVGMPSGPALIRGGQVVPIMLDTGDEECGPWSVVNGHGDVAWAGSKCGLFHGVGTSFERYPMPQRSKERLYAAVRSRDGSVWLGHASSGLLRIAPNGEARWFTTQDGLISNSIRSVAEDGEGTLWVGNFAGGLNQVRGEQVTTPELSGIGEMATAYHILRTSDDSIWFATRRGLVRWKDAHYVQLPPGRGMPPVAFFHQMLEDSHGYVWLTSSLGIFRVSLTHLNALADGLAPPMTEVAWFTDEDGLPSSVCAQTIPNSAHQCNNGKLCFATAGGVAVVDPRNTTPSKFAPPVYIERILFDGNPIADRNEPKLGPGSNDIEIDYAGLEYAFPHRMRFRHRLLGWHAEWSDPSQRRLAVYTNLTPGSYRFEVAASNSDGVWNPVTASFAFEISPRFYQTKSFYIVSTIALLGLVTLVTRLRTRSLQKQSRQLEATVQKRTEFITQRNEDMRLVLDNVNQGLLSLDARGVLAPERSAIVNRWFGTYGPETSFASFMQTVDPQFAESFGHAFEVLQSDVLPSQLAATQLPRKIQSGERRFCCAYTPLLEEDVFTGLLLVVSDVTTEVEQERKESERKELLSIFEGLTQDRLGLLAFFEDTDRMVALLPETGEKEQRESLHTLQGNAGLLGLEVLANICQHLEDAAADGPRLGAEQLVPLQERWKILSNALHSFVGDDGRSVVELHLRELHLLAERVSSGAPESEILDRLASWWLEDTVQPLRRLGRYAVALTARLGKGELQLTIQDRRVRLNPRTWSTFWSELVHVVRNAVDHGLELPHERRAAGKREAPRLRLSTCVTAGNLVVEVADNGRGIDWEAVRIAARELQLPHQSEGDLTASLFAPELTTRSELTTTSGRGVGLAALRTQVDKLGGRIVVTSRSAEGTRFRFEFPLAESGARFGVDPGEARC